MLGTDMAPTFDKIAYVSHFNLDANGKSVGQQNTGAVAGTVTLTRAENGNYAGSLDVATDSGHLEGLFDAALCDSIAKLTL